MTSSDAGLEIKFNLKILCMCGTLFSNTNVVSNEINDPGKQKVI